MYKEDVVHIFSGALFNYEKEQNSALCRDVVGLEIVIQTKSVRKRKKQIS